MAGLSLAFISILLAVFGQLSLKYGMIRHGEINLKINTLVKDFFHVFTRPFVMLGVVLYGLSGIIWIVVLSKLDLSMAYPLVSVSYVLVALLSKFLFKENISKLRWVSIIVIMIGVSIVSLS
ncbi:MAG: transporter [Nanoarchaeota archaeon]